MMFWLRLLPFLIFTASAFGQSVPDSAVFECLQPEGIFSRYTKYSIKPIPNVPSTHLTLYSDSHYFLKIKEDLTECAAHWQSEAMVVEIQGNDHEYFKVEILIYNKRFKANFSWISDGCESEPVQIIPTSASLILSDDKFTKGKKYFGHLILNTYCKGIPCQGRRFTVEGNFVFIIP